MEIELIEIDRAVSKCPDCGECLWWDGAEQCVVCVNSNDRFHRKITDVGIIERIKKWLRGGN